MTQKESTKHAYNIKNVLREKIEYYYHFNKGKGYIGLYLTKKEIRQLKIEENNTISEAYEKIFLVK